MSEEMGSMEICTREILWQDRTHPHGYQPRLTLLKFPDGKQALELNVFGRVTVEPFVKAEGHQSPPEASTEMDEKEITSQAAISAIKMAIEVIKRNEPGLIPLQWNLERASKLLQRPREESPLNVSERERLLSKITQYHDSIYASVDDPVLKAHLRNSVQWAALKMWTEVEALIQRSGVLTTEVASPECNENKGETLQAPSGCNASESNPARRRRQ